LRAFAVVSVLCVCLASTALPLDFIRHGEATPGMKGYGLTVFRGAEIEKFDFELLGTLRGVFPGQDIIICRIKHPVTDKAGIIAGMSGSPLYVVGDDGGEKLLGALAYGWSFQVDPIAGITPAYNMVEKPLTGALADYEAAPGPASVPAPQVSWPGLGSVRSPDETGVFRGALTAFQEDGVSGYPGGIRPLATPLMISGCSPKLMAEIRRSFEPLGLLPLEGPAGGQNPPEAPPELPQENPFKPGDPIGVRLLSGDMDWTATGTVTWTDGMQVFAFGHRFRDAGPCLAPITTADVITVISRSYSSFKLTETGREAGSLVFDHMAAIEGLVGRRAPTIPLEISGRVSGGEAVHKYRYRVSKVRGIWPLIAAYALWDSGDKMMPFSGPCRVRSKISLKLAGTDVPYEFSSVGVAAASAFPVRDLLEILSVLERNPFEEAAAESVAVSIEIEPGRHTAAIQRIEAPPVVYAGDRYTALVHIRPYGAAPDETETVKAEMTAPLVSAPAVLKLSAAPASSLRPPDPKPRTLAEMLDFASRVPSPETLRVVVAVQGGRGAGTAGVLLRHLPGSALPALGENLNLFSEGRETDYPVSYVLGGGAEAAVEVMPR